MHLLRLLLLALLAQGAGVALAEQEPQQKLRQVDKELGQVKRWLTDARKQQSSLLGTLRSTETEIARLSREVSGLREKIRSGEKREANLGKEEERLRVEIDEQKRLLYQQIRSSHMSGQQEYLKLLLNQSSPEIVLRMLKYYEYFHRARLERIHNYHARLEKLDETRHELRKTTAQLTEQRASLATELDALRGTRQARLGAVKELETSIRERDQRLQQLNKDREQLDALIQAMRHAIPDMPAPSANSPFPKQKGKLGWPTKGKLVKSGSRLHDNGVFIKAPVGRPVASVHHGQIVFADWMRRFGMLIIVDHGDGYMSLYAHNQSLLKEAGEWVQAGEALARVGDSGGQSSSGLYFEIRHEGKPVQTRTWLRQRR